MSEHTYRMLEHGGASRGIIEDAVRIAIATAARNEPNPRWFEVLETRGRIDRGNVAHWQVRVRIGATQTTTQTTTQTNESPGTNHQE